MDPPSQAPADGEKPQANGRAAGKRQKPKKEFDWSSASFAHFVLKIAYVGTNYHGLAVQEKDNVPTVEGCLFEALVKTRLIRDRQSCSFSRCGRTDRGVHAAGNYVSLQLRLKPQKPGVDKEDDYDYSSLLNGVLPQDIRVLAHGRAAEGFDARFSCLYRVYKYYFPLDGEDLGRMRAAAAHFAGEHDFRNFCKLDLENATHWTRRVHQVDVQARPGDVGEFLVVGAAFLWHQVRCMVAVLLLVGQGLEEPDIVRELLDVEKHPRKPIYDMADESGLVLYDCGFRDVPFAPGLPPESGAAPPATAAAQSAADAFRSMQAQARRSLAVSACLASALGEAEEKARGKYTPLLRRALGPSIEDKQQSLDAKKRRKGEATMAESAVPVDKIAE